MINYYNHPGEVREARNYICTTCGAVFRTPQGINGHLVRRHKIFPEDIIYKIHWDTTMKKACSNKPLPVSSR